MFCLVWFIFVSSSYIVDSPPHALFPNLPKNMNTRYTLIPILKTCAISLSNGYIIPPLSCPCGNVLKMSAQSQCRLVLPGEAGRSVATAPTSRLRPLALASRR